MRTKTSEGIHAQHSDEVDNKLKQTSLQPHTFIDLKLRSSKVDNIQSKITQLRTDCTIREIPLILYVQLCIYIVIQS